MQSKGKYFCFWLAALFLCLPAAKASAGLEAPVELQVVDEELAPVLQALGRLGGVNLLVDEAVRGKVTVQLSGVSLAQALELLTRLKGLAYQQVGTVVLVAPPERLRAVHVLPLRYARAAEVAELLGPALEPPAAKGAEGRKQDAPKAASRPPGRLQVDEAGNCLVFAGTEAELRSLAAAVAALDRPCSQVSLEAQVVAVRKSDLKQLGVEWEWQKTPVYPERSETTTSSSDGVTTTTTSGEEVRRQSLWGTIRYGRSPNGLPYEFYYQAKINALVSSGAAEILARPKLMTLNGKTAYINIGDSVPVPRESTEQNGRTTVTYDYKDVGIILRYTPRINEDGRITAAVHTEVSTPVLEAQLVPPAYRFSKREADTQVRLRDGETLVIGGLIGRAETRSLSKVPLLGDLPVLGALFRSRYHEQEDTEVVLFLTARIVKEGEGAGADEIPPAPAAPPPFGKGGRGSGQEG